MTLNLSKVLTWLAAAAVVLYLVNFPEQAAELVRTAGSGLVGTGAALVAFVTSLT